MEQATWPVCAPVQLCDGMDMDDTSESPIRLVVVDDHEDGRRQLVARLRKHPKLEVVGDAGDSREATHLTDTMHPDAILIEMRRLDKRGLAVVAELSSRDTKNRPAIVAYLEILHRGEWTDARAAGADDIVLKEMRPENAARELRQIVNRVQRDALAR